MQCVTASKYKRGCCANEQWYLRQHGFDTEEAGIYLQKLVCICCHGKRPCAYVATMMWWTSFLQNILTKYPFPVLPPQEAFMKHAEASYQVPGQFSMNVWVCNRNKFLWCKKDLTWAVLIMPLFANGFGMHFLTTWDLIQQVAILEHWETFERSK